MPTWIKTHDCDPAAFQIMTRHYSFRPYKDGRRQRPGYRNRFSFVGPGHKIVLVNSNYSALFVWRKFKHPSQTGVNCAVFRNESTTLSSTLILEAEKIINQIFPGERLFTYIDPAKVNSPNPGYCFKQAGWTHCGISSKGLHILEKSPCPP